MPDVPSRENAEPESGSIHQADTSLELVFGSVRAIGTDADALFHGLTDQLAPFGYACHRIKLSGLIRGHPLVQPILTSFEDMNGFEQRRSLMAAGDVLRKNLRAADAVAGLGVRAIQAKRRELGTPEDSASPSRHAYIVESFMHPAEVALFRYVYGAQFFLVGMYEHVTARVLRIMRWLSPEGAPRDEVPLRVKTLMDIDEGRVPSFAHVMGSPEARPYQLNVQSTFLDADVFVSVQDDLTEGGRQVLRRFSDQIMGDPFGTATRDELGMSHAYVAANRSSAFGRRVGAAILSKAGEVLSVGTNDVPAAGGGLYWNDPSVTIASPYRDVEIGFDSNQRFTAEVITDIVNTLVDQIGGGTPESIRAALQRTKVTDIIGYERIVHAEMDALTAAARLGVSPVDAILYSTTFPCHGCARHIVASGLDRVVYLEPYPKSRVFQLHEDSVKSPLADLSPDHVEQVAKVIGPPWRILSGTGAPSAKRVEFLPFIGIAPRALDRVFSMLPRKVGDVVGEPAPDGEPWEKVGFSRSADATPRHLIVSAYETLSRRFALNRIIRHEVDVERDLARREEEAGGI